MSKHGFGKAILAAGLFAGMGTAAFAQAPAQQPAPAPAAGQSAPTTVEPLTLPSSAPPVNAEEDAAMKAFREMPNTDLPKKTQAGEEFAQKYTNSRYLPEVYAWLLRSYLSQGQMAKMEAVGEKDLAIVPNDAQTLAILGTMIARGTTPTTPDAEKRLAKAEDYLNRAIEVAPTMQKPADMQDEMFDRGRRKTIAMGHAGLGVVQFRRNKFPEAINELEQAVRLDPQPDPVSYYLLGIANQKASHFDAAVAAFERCASLPGSLQNSCKNSMEEAKKLAATQLSVPK